MVRFEDILVGMTILKKSENLKTILSTIEQILYAFTFGIQGCEYKDLIHMVIHCDFHPGNLKFQNNAITGLFDFDWSKVDVRCFDVALAIIYFCLYLSGFRFPLNGFLFLYFGFE